MAQTILITLTAGGIDTGPFDLYTDVDGYTTPFANNIAKAILEAGYTSVVVPDGATIIRVQSDNIICSNFTDLVIVTTTTTTTSTSTSTTTSTSSTTTTTTTTILLNYETEILNCFSCDVEGSGYISGAYSLTIGGYYHLTSGQIGFITGVMAIFPPSYDIASFVNLGSCVGDQCL